MNYAKLILAIKGYLKSPNDTVKCLSPKRRSTCLNVGLLFFRKINTEWKEIEKKIEKIKRGVREIDRTKRQTIKHMTHSWHVWFYVSLSGFKNWSCLVIVSLDYNIIYYCTNWRRRRSMLSITFCDNSDHKLMRS